MKDTDKTRGKTFGFILLMEEKKDNVTNRIEKAIQERAVFQEKVSKFIVDSEDAVPMRNISHRKGHDSGPLNGILIATGWTETAMTAERNEFMIGAFWTQIHSAAIRRISAMDHFIYIFDYGCTRMEKVNHFFIVIRKDFLKNVHDTIMQPGGKKENPFPQDWGSGG